MIKKLRLNKERKIEWLLANDIKRRIRLIVSSLNLDWINLSRIYCYRSSKSKSRAFARIWGLSRIWQLSLREPPAYVIEVLSERFDKLSDRQKDEVLLHEIAHIPKNFSGSLIPHYRKGRVRFKDLIRSLQIMYNNVLENK